MKTMKTSIGCALLTWLLMTAAGSAAQVDPRFFGEYCGADRVEHCVDVKVKFLGATVGERTECRTIDLENIRLRLDHEETAQGGLVTGAGGALVDGEPAAFVVSGAVVRPGLLRGSATVQSLEPHHARAVLSEDGLGLKVFAYGKQVEVRKDACGNQPPQAEITSPDDGETISFGSMQLFAGRVEDAEDESVPEERQSFVSSRDGELSGSTMVFPNGLNVSSSTLSPGEHVITYSVTDSGGLTDTASITVTVTNDAPEEPTIVQPQPGDTIVATGPVVLEGKAYDPEQQMLPGSALSWSATPAAATSQVSLGTGRQLTTSFDEPGDYVLRLTATDELGAQTSAERPITVEPFTGNTPPVVTIEVPNPLDYRGEVAAVLVAGPVDFVGTVADSEDPASDLSFHWHARSVDPTGVDTEFGEGSTAATQDLSAVGGQNTRYEITFSATDSGGMESDTSIDLLILASPIL